MRTSIVVLGIALLLVALAGEITANPNLCDPVYEEFTDKADCDFNCQEICEPVQDWCLCKAGYLRDLTTGKCIPDDQCLPLPESIKLDCLTT